MDWLNEWTKKLSLRKSFTIYLFTFFLLGISLAKVNTILINSYEIKSSDNQMVEVSLIKDDEIKTYYYLKAFNHKKTLPDSNLFKLIHKSLLLYRDYAVEIHCLLFAILAFAVFYRHKLQKPIGYLNSYSNNNSCSSNINDNNNNDDDESNDIAVTLPEGENELCKACEKINIYTRDLHEDKIKIWRQYDAFNHMISSIGHDIRTPLTVLKGNQEMMWIFEEENSESNMSKISNISNISNIPDRSKNKRLELLASMERQTQRIQEYVEKIKNLQSMDKLVIKKCEISLKDFIATLEKTINALPDNKRIHWTKLQEDRTIFIDSIHIQEVFENIMSNAIRFASKNVYIEFCVTDKELKIRIQDDGPGFSKEALSYATSAFFCENPTDGHMGLGLNISSIIIEKHGGKLLINNTKCGGTAEIIINL
ncbi:MAG TPA: HAMP domain-containing sensor histidine kinase [Clostridiales bacterium]|nr:HAMP domain-containing sensor histidine kinase [Clostridiales bacterium]